MFSTNIAQLIEGSESGLCVMIDATPCQILNISKHCICETIQEQKKVLVFCYLWNKI